MALRSEADRTELLDESRDDDLQAVGDSLKYRSTDSGARSAHQSRAAAGRNASTSASRFRCAWRTSPSSARSNAPTSPSATSRAPTSSATSATDSGAGARRVGEGTGGSSSS